MKKLLFYSMIFAFSFAVTSCNNSDESVQQVVENPTPVKTLKVMAEDNESYMILDIYNPDLVDLTVDNFVVTPKFIDEATIEEIRIASEAIGPVDNEPHTHLPGEEHEHAYEGDDDGVDIVVSDSRLATGMNALNLKYVNNGMLRGDGPSSFIYDGNNGQGQCVHGFYGYPWNCSHTHWKVSKKNNSGSIFWNQLYKKTTYNSSSVYYYTTATYAKWRLKVDPDKSCNGFSGHTAIYNSSCD